MDWLPVSFGVRSLFRRHQDFLSSATDSWEIGAACERVNPPAIFYEEELDRILDYQQETNPNCERRRILGGRSEHAASRMYRFADVVVRDGYLYGMGSRISINGLGQGPLLRIGRPQVLEKAMLVGSPMTAKYFGQWVTDQLPQEMTAKELDIGSIAVANDVFYPHEAGYRQLAALQCVISQWCQVRQLYYSIDYGQNDYKRQRYIELRERIRNQMNPIENSGVFILRKGYGSRVLENEQEIAQHLAHMGFAIIDPQRHSVSEIMNAMSQTPLVIGVESSALCHAVAMMPITSAVLSIQSPRRFNASVKDYTDCLGMRYAFTVGDFIDQERFCLPIERLNRVLELVSSRMEHLVEQ